ncbi:MAG: OmpA family protein [Alphaproteobacteria bacterium]
MKRSLAYSIPMCLALVASGCALNPFAGDPVKEAKEMTPTGSAFNQALYRAYLTRAEEKAELGQRAAARYFAGRARTAGSGQAVLPEDLAMDRVGQQGFSELNEAHDSLVKLLVDGGRDKAPEDSAQSQSYFDCWVKASEAKDAGEGTRCKTAFGTSVSNLQVALNAAPTTPVTAEATPASAGGGEKRGFTVYFGFDEWHLSAEALTKITEAIDTARKEGQSEIVDAGHTDRAGAAPYNVKLSKRRADVVKEVMVQMGARDEAIKVEAHGESQPAVATADGVKEAKNRRVEITLLP